MSILLSQPAHSQRLLGVVLYEGPSLLDGQPIVVIATGLARLSANPKTGDMVQTWVLCRDVDPFAAIHNGQDVSVCGDCPLRGILETTPGKHPSINRQRACRDPKQVCPCVHRFYRLITFQFAFNSYRARSG